MYDPFGSGTQTGIGCVFLSMCVFFIPRVFYRCPTTSVAPRLKNTCRPGRKIFQFQNHYRPCVDHNAVRATPDCVHRVTVLCAVLCTLSHISDHLGVFGVRSTCAVGPAHAVPHCSTVSYCAVLIPCCAVYVYSPCRRRMVGNAPTPWVLSQIGGTLPIVTMPGDQTKNQVVLHVESPTKPYQDPCSRREHHWCIWLGRGPLTIPYQSIVLAPPPSSCTFTNHYRPRS